MIRRSNEPGRGSRKNAAAVGVPIFRTFAREAKAIRHSSTGDVGLLYSGDGIESVWVSKQAERVDRRWFWYPHIDILVVLRGRLRVEFRDGNVSPRILEPGDVLALPANTRCRAYRWPRHAPKPTIFLAVYRKAGRTRRTRPGHRTGR